MRKIIPLTVLVVFLGSLACRQTAESAKKIPITTSSAEARAAYLKARDLIENVHAEAARPLLEEAIGKDPNFAMAHLMQAQTATSPTEFFQHIKAAVAAADKVSDGEQLLIRSQEAYANGDNKMQREALEKLVAAYPGDERAHWFLGIYHYGLQENDAAIAELQKTTELAPNYAPAYNILGYALSQAEKNKDAEAAFRKYVELIPNEPNPHDSLAELLLKMGRFSESIESYRKALSIDAGFLSAYRGIAAGLMYQEKHKEAQEQLQKGLDSARDDGERHVMLTAMAACNADEGRLSDALAMLAKRSALAEKQADKASMAQVASTRMFVLREAGRVAEAEKESARALEFTMQSTTPDGAKKGFEVGHHGSLALLAAAKRDFEGAAKEAEAMRAGFETMGDTAGLRSAHEVLGEVALRQGRYDEAIAQLKQADQTSPHAMFQLAKAYAGKKDAANAKTFYQKAATAYTLPSLSYALVRRAAVKAAK